MQCIHDANLSFKLFLLAGPRFDELCAKSRGRLELHALLHNSKSAPGVLMIKLNTSTGLDVAINTVKHVSGNPWDQA